MDQQPSINALLPSLRPDSVTVVRPCGRIAQVFPPEFDIGYRNCFWSEIVAERSQAICEKAFEDTFKGAVYGPEVIWIKTVENEEMPTLVRWFPMNFGCAGAVVFAMRLSAEWAHLSDREKEVITWLKTKGEIKKVAGAMKIKISTVQAHIRNIKAKCHLYDDLTFWKFISRHGRSLDS